MGNPFRLVNITPELAAELLGKNTTENRSVRSSKVSAFARDIKAGKWRTTHQAIAFDWTGQLIDGQHRLRAIVKAGKPTEMWVYENLDPTTFTVIDSGSARNAGDFLRRYGFSNAPIVAAATRLVIRYRLRQAQQELTCKSHALSHSEIEKYTLANKELCNQAASYARSVHKEYAKLRSASVAALCLIAAEQSDAVMEEAQIFVSRTATGADLRRGSVELAFRKYLDNSTPRTHNLNSTDFSLAVLLKAFNAYASREPMLVFRPGSLVPYPSLMQVTF